MSEFVGVDVGAKRVGIATAEASGRIAHAVITVTPQELVQTILGLTPQMIIVGLPRGLDGQETAQTRFVREFTQQHLIPLSLPIHFQDEAGTSSEAESRLRASGKKYVRGDIDAEAAAIILQDYLDESL